MHFTNSFWGRLVVVGFEFLGWLSFWFLMGLKALKSFGRLLKALKACLKFEGLLRFERFIKVCLCFEG